MYLKYLRDNLLVARNPAVWLSFGKDSLLTFHLARNYRDDLTIYYFGDSLSEFVQDYIMKHDLTVMTYAPAERYIVPNGEGIALVDEYALNNTFVPFVSPLVRGEGCRHKLSLQRTPRFAYPHDLTLVGYKSSETCPAVGVTFPQEMEIGGSRFISPLYDLTDRDVFEALEVLEVPYGDECNEIEVCDDCFSEINQSLDRDAALTTFRSRHGFNH